MSNSPFDFLDAIRAAGLTPLDVIEPGTLYRFPGAGKRKGNTAGWCLLFDDGLGGCFGDWSTSRSEIWQAKRDRTYSKYELAAFASRVNATRKRLENERKILQADAAERATAIWNDAIPAPENHPYLIRKQIRPYGVQVFKGALVLPVQDFSGKLTSLQFIGADGSKRLLKGGRKKGCYINVAGTLRKPRFVIICEGWATGCTLAANEPTALVLAAIDAGNLELVAVHARCQWAYADLVIAGDDDRMTPGNPGVTKARAAAIATGAGLALPQWPEDAPEYLTDFNDLVVWQAGGAV